MKKKEILIYLILGVIIISIILIIFLVKNNNYVDKELAKCIANKSELYVQLGCGGCKIQEEMFGKNYQYLDIIDCTYEGQKCLNAGITGTPTWVINQEKYRGVQSIEELKKLTGC